MQLYVLAEHVEGSGYSVVDGIMPSPGVLLTGSEDAAKAFTSANR
jgi:hypothetical protein